MFTLNNQQINVNRLDMIKAVGICRDQHRAQYETAQSDYRTAVVVFMQDAAKRAEAGDFRDLVLRLVPPTNHDQDYLEVLEMLEASVDETITLDRQSFNAYYRNQWAWSKSFEDSAMAYKTVLGSLSGRGK